MRVSYRFHISEICQNSFHVKGSDFTEIILGYFHSMVSLILATTDVPCQISIQGALSLLDQCHPFIQLCAIWHFHSPSQNLGSPHTGKNEVWKGNLRYAKQIIDLFHLHPIQKSLIFFFHINLCNSSLFPNISHLQFGKHYLINI